MRIAYPLLALSALAATPALAAEPDTAQTVEQKVAAEKKGEAAASVGDLQKQLADPATKARLSAIAVAMTEAMMDMKVGPMVAAAEGRQPTKAEKKATVRDMVGANDPAGEAKIKAAAANSGEMLQGAAAMMSAMLPKLIGAMESMDGEMEKVVANLPRPVDPSPKAETESR